MHSGKKLFEAIKRGDANESEISIILQLSDLDLSYQENKITAIELAALEGKWNIVSLIVRNTKKPLRSFNFGDALLSAAQEYVKKNSVEIMVIIKTILETNPALTWITIKTGENALHVAVKAKSMELIDLLLKHDNENILKAKKNTKEFTPIQAAAKAGAWEVVRKLAPYPDHDHTYNTGSALLMAAQANEFSTAKILLKRAKATTTWKIKTNNYTSLHFAAFHNNTDLVNLLLQFEAKHFKRNTDLLTPIELACQSKSWAAAEALTEADPIKFKYPAKTVSVLLSAVLAGNTTVMNYFIASGIDINAPLKEGDTCLHQAVKQRSAQGLDVLLPMPEVDHTKLNQDKKTAVELASEQKDWLTVEKLIQAVKDKNIPQLLLHYDKVLLNAIKDGNYAIVNLLLDQHTPCDQWTCEENNIFLHAAIDHGHDQILELLLAKGNEGENQPFDLFRKDKNHETILDFAKGKKNGARSLQILEKYATQFSSRNRPFLTAFEKEMSAINEHYRLIILNQLPADQIPIKILALNKHYRLTFALLTKSLQEKRHQLEQNKEKPALVKGQMEELDSLLSISGLIAHYAPEDCVAKEVRQFQQLKQQRESQHLASDTEIEVNFIMDYLDRQRKFQDYSIELKTKLQELKTSINETSWQIKRWYRFVPGQPQHIKSIAKTLEMVDDCTDLVTLAKMYADAIKTFQEALNHNSKDRHPATKAAYWSMQKKLKALTVEKEKPCLAAPPSAESASAPLTTETVAYSSPLSDAPPTAEPQALYPKLTLTQPPLQGPFTRVGPAYRTLEEAMKAMEQSSLSQAPNNVFFTPADTNNQPPSAPNLDQLPSAPSADPEADQSSLQAEKPKKQAVPMYG